MCMICGVANPSHEQAMLTVAALVVGGAGGLLVPWHVLEEPVRKAGTLFGHKPHSGAGDETADTVDPAPPAGSTPTAS